MIINVISHEEKTKKIFWLQHDFTYLDLNHVGCVLLYPPVSLTVHVGTLWQGKLPVDAYFFTCTHARVVRRAIYGYIHPVLLSCHVSQSTQTVSFFSQLIRRRKKKCPDLYLRPRLNPRLFLSLFPTFSLSFRCDLPRPGRRPTESARKRFSPTPQPLNAPPFAVWFSRAVFRPES